MLLQVRSSGSIGGRGNLASDFKKGKDTIQFSDHEVSRRHFEIAMQFPDVVDSNLYCYAIRDLGSIAGTFIRIPYGQRKELHPGKYDRIWSVVKI